MQPLYLGDNSFRDGDNLDHSSPSSGFWRDLDGVDPLVHCLLDELLRCYHLHGVHVPRFSSVLLDDRPADLERGIRSLLQKPGPLGQGQGCVQPLRDGDADPLLCLFSCFHRRLLLFLPSLQGAIIGPTCRQSECGRCSQPRRPPRR